MVGGATDLASTNEEKMSTSVWRRYAIGVLFILMMTPANLGSAQVGTPTIVYLSAADCPNCRAFNASQRPAFLASPEARRVQFREVERDTLRRPLVDSDWPQDLKWLPAAAGGQIRPATPGFIVIQGNTVVLVTYGVSNWTSMVLPKVRELLKTAG